MCSRTGAELMRSIEQASTLGRTVRPDSEDSDFDDVFEEEEEATDPELKLFLETQGPDTLACAVRVAERLGLPVSRVAKAYACKALTHDEAILNLVSLGYLSDKKWLAGFACGADVDPASESPMELAEKIDIGSLISELVEPKHGGPLCASERGSDRMLRFFYNI